MFIFGNVFLFAQKTQVQSLSKEWQKVDKKVFKILDSLVNLLENEKKVKKYFPFVTQFDSVVIKYIPTTDTLLRSHYIDKLVENFKQKEDKNELAKAYIFGSYITNFNRKKAMSYLKEAQKIAQETLQTDLLIHILKNKGFYYAEYFLDYKQGIVFLLEALKVAKKYNLARDEANIRGSIALIYYKSQSYGYAKAQLVALLEEKQTYLTKREKINHHNTLGLCEAKMQNLKSAEEYYYKAINLAKEYKDTVWIGLASGNLASIYIKQNKYEPAIKLLRVDILYSEKYKEWGSSLLSHLAMALCYAKMQELEKADVFYKKAQKIYQDYKLEGVKEPFYEMSLEYLLYKGDAKNAMRLLKLVQHTRDSFKIIRQTEEMLKVQGAYDVIQKQDIITRLKKEKDAQDKNVQTQYYLIAGLIIMIIFGSSGTFILYFIYLKNRKLTKQLQTQNEQIITQNEHIIAQTEELEKNNTTKDKLFSIISHDFRSPLANLSSVFRLLQDKSITPVQFAQFVPDFQRRLDVTLGFVDNLLYWAKSQMYGLETMPQTVNIKNIIKETLELSQSQTEKKKIEVIDETQPHLQVFVDANMLRVVFRNLLTNAIKFSFQNGKIWLMAWDMGDFIKVGVKDEGVGMTPEQVKGLFKEDTLHTTLGTQNEKGTGLGLMLCYEFVLANHGKMEVESQKDEGTTFFFSLPKNIKV